MNCSHVQELTSAYLDGELPEERCREVAEHLHGCATCAEERSDFERISLMASRLESPMVPAETWDGIQRQLHHQPELQRVAFGRWWNQPLTHRLALAASVLILVGLGTWFNLEQTNPQGASNLPAIVNLAPYLQQFYRNPNAAQQDFLAQYAHREVTPEEAEQEIKYRPVLAETLPGGFVRESLRLVEMPCCTCVQTIYRNSESELLATFQQMPRESFSFKGCAEKNCMCNGVDTQIVEVEGGVTASWAIDDTRLTLVGSRDMSQVLATMESLVAFSGIQEE